MRKMCNSFIVINYQVNKNILKYTCNTYVCPARNSFIIASLSFCGMSPCIELTVKFDSLIFSVNQSTYAIKCFNWLWLTFLSYFNDQWLTFLLVLQKITAWVIVSVSYKSHKVSNFHSSRSTATKNCLIPSSVNSSL